MLLFYKVVNKKPQGVWGYLSLYVVDCPRWLTFNNGYDIMQ